MAGIFGKIKSGASRTAFEADKLRRSKKAEGELAQLRKQIDTFQERLGEITYLNYIHQEPQGQDSIDYIEKLKELEQQVVEKLEEIKSIQEETYEQTEPSDPNYIKCPNCGKTNAINTKFCNECGTRLS